jgi:hypothetical protein
MKNHQCNAWVITAVFGDSDPLRAAYGNDPMGDEEDFPTVPEKVFGAARLAVAMGKSTENLEWDEPIGDATPAPAKPAKSFIKSSDERFVKVSAAIRQLCGPHGMETAGEMIEAAKKLRDGERAEFLANA